MRAEQTIFDDLADLCTSPGYIHAIAYLCFRDTFVHYKGEMSGEDLQPLFSPQRLIGSEISTLIGLMAKADIDYALPSASVVQRYLDQTEALLEELHQAILGPVFSGLSPAESIPENLDPLTRGPALREMIFYSGEAAYGFQHRDFSALKYQRDSGWLQLNQGFTIEIARDVAYALERLKETKLSTALEEMQGLPPEQWTFLEAFSFSLPELSKVCSHDKESLERVLSAFTLPEGKNNLGFCRLHDFNATNAMPLLRRHDGSYILFSQYRLSESLYESPFYWMVSDKNYANAAMTHRGQFTEEFSRKRLEVVFGKQNVHSNVSIYESRDRKCGEIDVLVMFADRAIVLQAKSKRLTIEARRGNDRQIKDDFQKSVQDSYDQGYKCARLLAADRRYRLVGADDREILISNAPKEIYIITVVSDGYPALHFQSQQFLRFEQSGTIAPPLITDVFALDVMAEMLDSPLYFLSYLKRRTGYHDRLLARDELTILAYHLKRNLWIDDEYDLVMLEDDVSADLDAAMSVRRDNVPGKRTPDGILTRVKETALGRIVKEIETGSMAQTIDLGLMLLSLSEVAVRRISKAIDATISKAQKDGDAHDVSVALPEAGSGLTIHCNDSPLIQASRRLRGHCRMRKYAQRARSWFGICLSPFDTP